MSAARPVSTSGGAATAERSRGAYEGVSEGALACADGDDAAGALDDRPRGTWAPARAPSGRDAAHSRARAENRDSPRRWRALLWGRMKHPCGPISAARRWLQSCAERCAAMQEGKSTKCARLNFMVKKLYHLWEKLVKSTNVGRLMLVLAQIPIAKHGDSPILR
jgi:hypothetical protein